MMPEQRFGGLNHGKLFCVSNKMVKFFNTLDISFSLELISLIHKGVKLVWHIFCGSLNFVVLLKKVLTLFRQEGKLLIPQLYLIRLDLQFFSR